MIQGCGVKITLVSTLHLRVGVDPCKGWVDEREPLHYKI